MAKIPKLKLVVGDVAPAFSALATDGSTVHLSALSGHHIILYFYPKDDTPGCTKEACAFRDAHADFKKRGVIVLGVSPDDVKAHAKFTDKFKLPFLLLADTEKKSSVRTEFGVKKALWVASISGSIE